MRFSPIKLAATALLVSSAITAVKADSVSVDSSCFDVGESITVTFDKDEDENFIDNWIGIWHRSDLGDTQSLPEGALWISLCGSQSCNTANNPSQGSVVFQGSGQAWSESWPLPEGRYRAVLTRGDDGEDWPALAMSSVFTVGCGDSSPVASPTDSEPSPVSNSNMGSVINDARRDIEDLIDSSSILIGKFLRLAFHDCVGGCDGCVDMTNPDNAGLVIPIDALEPIVNNYGELGLSRTDIWMLSAVVASEVADTEEGIGFPFQWIGRKTCEELNNDDCGTDSEGNQATCGPFGGPHRRLCHGDVSGTSTIEDFMSSNFGFDAQQTAAIMGAHSVGAMRAVNLGFEGRNGWDITNDVLDQGYYVELLGDDQNDPADWEQIRLSNDGLDGIPPRFQFDATVDGRRLTMLNSDIAMVRNLVEGENLDSDGRVTCDFNECDNDTPFMPFMTEYANNLSLFLRDYRDALNLMIDNGYRRGSSCGDGEVCVLQS